jgi:hypothetical protein
MGKPKSFSKRAGTDRKPILKERSGSRGDSFIFLNTTFNKIPKETVMRHVAIIAGISILTKFLVFFATESVFHSFIDQFDHSYYLQWGINILNGQLPYIHFNVDYPPLIFVPVLIALLAAVIAHGAAAFFVAFQGMMLFSDILIAISIYMICLKLFGEKRAFPAALLYSTAFASSYFVLTKFDPLPTLFLMGGLLFTIYGWKKAGYLSVFLGFFSKIFPVLALPYVLFYNRKESSLKSEIFSLVKIGGILAIILFIPLFLMNFQYVNSFLFATGASLGVYVNSATYTIYSILSGILGLDIPALMVSNIMYFCMAVSIVALLIYSYRERESNPQTLLKFVLLTLFSVIFFSKFHSPQYFFWLAPIFAILLSDSVFRVILFYITQAVAYTEFPLLFGRFYVNEKYLFAAGTAEWYVTVGFFVIEYCVLIIAICCAVRPADGLTGMMKKVLKNFGLRN